MTEVAYILIVLELWLTLIGYYSIYVVLYDVDCDKINPLKKRRTHSSSDKSPLASPGIKPALTERQQLALVMQMTTPHKQDVGQGANTTPGSSGRSKLHRRNERG